MKTIAVIGAGISGLAAAYFLSRKYRVHVFERDARIGGHTNTVHVETPDGRLALDTGFLVYNERTYPNLTRLFAELGVETRASDMSFAVSAPHIGLEYSSRGVAGFFADPRRWVDPGHYRLLAEVVRFNAVASASLESDDGLDGTVDAFLEQGRFTQAFIDHYLKPMASAIWSTPAGGIGAFPAVTMLRFFDNHGLLALRSQPTWRVVANGSASYIPKLTRPFVESVHCNVDIRAVCRSTESVTLTFADRASITVDQVVFACGGDRVLKLLPAPTEAERRVFGAFSTTTNTAWLHRDASFLPRRPRAQASWNYLVTGNPSEPPVVTYDLNRLQGLASPQRYCVTLNPSRSIDEAHVIDRFVYHHPLYTHQAIGAQQSWASISGAHRTHYCGAYWGHGFHEDGLSSALRVARALGVEW
ncbi:MAG TPA: FAD-dependent oxidoreductase [Vicinamibacterales bacterium]